MADKILFIIAFGILAFLVGFAFIAPASAQNPFDIEYPVTELGNCGFQQECKVFCDDPTNQDVCLAWAADNGLISREELEDIEKHKENMERFEEKIPEGPGGCTSPEECDAFCSQTENNEECLNFGVENGFIPPEEAERIREEMNKEGPGGCQSREECDAFCSQPENEKQCILFAVEDGFMTQEEADFFLEMMDRREEFEGGPRGPRGPHGPGGPGGPGPGEPDIDEEKVLELLQTQTGPGGCGTMEECEEYCGGMAHADECMAFAIENELIPPEEIKFMKKILDEGGPGGCKGPEECDEFCSQEEHQKECFNFAKENDLIPPEELEFVEKMMDEGGPGGCRGEKQCNEFCQNPEHMEECMMFSVDMGMMTKQEASKMIDQMRRMEERGRKMEKEFSAPGGPASGWEGPRDGEDFGPPEGFEPRDGDFGPRDGERGERRSPGDFFNSPPEDFEGFEPRDFDREGPRPDEQGFEHREFEDGRSDFERFEDFKNFEGEFREQIERDEFENKFREFAPEDFEEFIPPKEFKEGFAPPENFIPPESFEGFAPPEGFIPPESFTEPIPSGEFIPPSDGEFIPPPPEEPVSFRQSLFGTVLGPFLDIFR